MYDVDVSIKQDIKCKPGKIEVNAVNNFKDFKDE